MTRCLPRGARHRTGRWLLVGTLCVLAACRQDPHGSPADADAIRALRVCADPNNLPFSNDREEGFENRLARLIADEIGADLEYTWWAQRRGFVRNTVGAGSCDVVMGVPVQYDPLATTRPYYRSTYVFLHRQDRHLSLTSLDDPVLAALRIGVHVIGDDYSNPPPAHALAARGIQTRGYSIYGDYREPNPPARLVEAAASGEIDVAAVWGPFAGYFARQADEPMVLTPIPPVADMPALTFAFDIAVGVSRTQEALRHEIDQVLARRAPAVQALLDEFAIPRLDETAGRGDPDEWRASPR